MNMKIKSLKIIHPGCGDWWWWLTLHANPELFACRRHDSVWRHAQVLSHLETTDLVQLKYGALHGRHWKQNFNIGNELKSFFSVVCLCGAFPTSFSALDYDVFSVLSSPNNLWPWMTSGLAGQGLVLSLAGHQIPTFTLVFDHGRNWKAMWVLMHQWKKLEKVSKLPALEFQCCC